jgi:iron complex transport system permease protein
MQRSLPRVQPALRLGPLVLSLGVLLVVIVLAVAYGSVATPPLEVLQSLWRGLRGEFVGSADTIIWQMRLPRVLLAASVGAALALSGAVFQGVFRNPLADPYLLGVASGAGFGATVVMVFAAALPLVQRLGVPLAAFGFGILSVVAVFWLAREGRSVPLISLILAGVVIGSVLSAATSLLMLYARAQALSILSWLLGSFAFASWRQVATMAVVLVLTSGVLLASGRVLNVLQLGEEQAQQLGLEVERIKLLLLALSTLLTAVAVSVSGIIGFVGLMVPHLVRLTWGADYRRLLPQTLVGGAAFLVLADLLARTLIAPGELPIGIITALLGGPFFLLLLRRQQRRRC